MAGFRYIIYIAVAIAAAMLFSCRNSIEDIRSLQQLDSLPVESVSDVYLTYSDSGIIKIRLRSPQMDRYEGDKEYMELPKGIHVEFLEPDGRTSTRLTANYAVKLEDQDVFEARDKVVVVNERNERLDTEVLRWNRGEKKIYTDGFVKITTPTEILIGDGLEADERFDQWRIMNPSGVFYLNENAKKAPPL
jgi:LPS export ABC transporter protein LptC